MRSRTTRKFWRLYEGLAPEVQLQARRAYARFRLDPAYPSLNFKRVHATEPVYSARIDIRHRALGLVEGDVVTWFWIGPHDDYERMLSDGV